MQVPSVFCGIFVSVALGCSSAALAEAINDPSVGGQLNQCWGQVASQLAKVEPTGNVKGGGMGAHSRSTKAADQVGGFANSNNAFGITFNVNGGRTGVGNVSKGLPHDVHPGDGGNGAHAINNSSSGGFQFSTILDPTNGQFVGAGGVDPNLHCDVP